MGGEVNQLGEALQPLQSVNYTSAEVLNRPVPVLWCCLLNPGVVNKSIRHAASKVISLTFFLLGVLFKNSL